MPALPQLSEAMPIRLRKLVGAIMLIVLVVAWAVMAMALAQSPLVKANGAIEVNYYVVAGLGWVLPATPQHRRDQQAAPRSSLCFAGSSATPAVSIPEKFLGSLVMVLQRDHQSFHRPQWSERKD